MGGSDVEHPAAARAAGSPGWVTADSVYGVGEVEMELRRAGKGYVLGVTSGSQFWSWGNEEAMAGTAKDIAAALPASGYVRLSAGDGSKGPRLYDWAYLELADLDAEAEGYPGSHGLWTRGLLVRRSLTDQDLAFFTTWCPQGTSIETLVQVEGCRWAIEDAFETARTELGLACEPRAGARAERAQCRRCGFAGRGGSGRAIRATGRGHFPDASTVRCRGM